MKTRIIPKTDVIIFRVTDSLKTAIRLCVDRGNYVSMSQMINVLLRRQFRKYLSNEERKELVRSRKRVSPMNTSNEN